MGNIATGLLAGQNAARIHKNQKAFGSPATTMLGALCHYVTHADLKDFQPMKANFGIMPPLEARTAWETRARQGVYRTRQRAISKPS